MKNISPALQAHLDGELTTLAELIKITRTDGVVKAFTTHDVDLTIGGVLYKADGSFSAKHLDNAASLATKSLEIVGLLDSTILSDVDIKAGLYDHARIDVSICNWMDSTQGVVQLRRGWIGEVQIIGGKYTAALRGMHDLLQRTVSDTYTPECRYDLGDVRCTVNLAAVAVTGTVSTVTDEATFTDFTRTELDGVFNYGILTWTSGANNGLRIEVQNWDGVNQIFSLWLPMENPIQVGDTYSVYPGCDKRLTTCGAKFNNVTNFGGFPHLPGLGNILQYPDSSA